MYSSQFTLSDSCVFIATCRDLVSILHLKWVAIVVPNYQKFRQPLPQYSEAIIHIPVPVIYWPWEAPAGMMLRCITFTVSQCNYLQKLSFIKFKGMIPTSWYKDLTKEGMLEPRIPTWLWDMFHSTAIKDFLFYLLVIIHMHIDCVKII